MKSRKVKLNIGDCLHDLIIGGVFFFKEDTKLTIKEKTKLLTIIRMNKKKQFKSPRVIQQVEVLLERDLLGKSLEDVAGVITMGQGVIDYDFSSGEEPADYTAEWD